MCIFQDKIRKSLIGRQHIHLPSIREPSRTPLEACSSYPQWIQKRHKNPLCLSNMKSVTSGVKNNWKLFLFKMELKQYFMMTRSCHNCFNWRYSCVISVYCVCICICLSQVMLENGFSAPFTYRVNKSIMSRMYISQPHLFISDGPAICTLHTFHAHMFISHR